MFAHLGFSQDKKFLPKLVGLRFDSETESINTLSIQHLITYWTLQTVWAVACVVWQPADAILEIECFLTTWEEAVFSPKWKLCVHSLVAEVSLCGFVKFFFFSTNSLICSTCRYSVVYLYNHIYRFAHAESSSGFWIHPIVWIIFENYWH